MADPTMDYDVSSLINDLLSYILERRGYQWVSSNGHSAPNQVNFAMRTLCDEFLNRYRERIMEMCNNLEMSEDTFKGVVNELFNEGIKWTHIIAFFAFGSELAVLCKENGRPQLIDNISQWIASYVSTNLLGWINDHGGWEGIIQFQEGREGDPEEELKWPRFKNFVCGVAAGALGVLTIGAFLTTKS